MNDFSAPSVPSTTVSDGRDLKQRQSGRGPPAGGFIQLVREQGPNMGVTSNH